MLLPFFRLPPLKPLVLVLGALAMHPAAFAQWSGSVTAVSEYRYRGMDFSDGKPSVQGGVAYDGSGGWYAGAFGAMTRLNGRRGAQVVAYGGRARRLDNGLAWDAGFSAVHGTQQGYGDYQELYAGLSHAGTDGGMSARLSWSPRYYGSEARTLYGEIDASTALAAGIDVFIHIGTLHTLSGPRQPQRADLRTGLSGRIGAFGVQVAWVRNNHRAAPYRSADPYGYDARPSRQALVVSVSRGF